MTIAFQALERGGTINWWVRPGNKSRPAHNYRSSFLLVRSALGDSLSRSKVRQTMMAPQDLESELKKEPFQPFRIVTTNGKTYDIREKDRPLLLVGKRTVIIGLRVPETDPYFDRYEVVSLVHIIRLEPIPIAQQQSA